MLYVEEALAVALSAVRKGAETGVDVLKDTFAEEDSSDEPYEREHVQVLCFDHHAPRLRKGTEGGVDVTGSSRTIPKFVPEDTSAEEDLSDEPYEREHVQALCSDHHAPRNMTVRCVLQEVEAIFIWTPETLKEVSSSPKKKKGSSTGFGVQHLFGLI